MKDKERQGLNHRLAWRIKDRELDGKIQHEIKGGGGHTHDTLKSAMRCFKRQEKIAEVEKERAEEKAVLDAKWEEQFVAKPDDSIIVQAVTRMNNARDKMEGDRVLTVDYEDGSRERLYSYFYDETASKEHQFDLHLMTAQFRGLTRKAALERVKKLEEAKYPCSPLESPSD